MTEIIYESARNIAEQIKEKKVSAVEVVEAHLRRIDEVNDPNFAYWHSATFNNDGTKLVFTDEWGGGGQPRCRPSDPATWGADAIFTIEDGKMELAGYYKLPVPQTDTENCVAHNGSIIPVPGRDIMVQAWYQGGLSIMDFTDPAHAFEIAFFDRGPLSVESLFTGGYWSTYWHNGRIYGGMTRIVWELNEVVKGQGGTCLVPGSHNSPLNKWCFLDVRDDRGAGSFDWFSISLLRRSCAGAFCKGMGRSRSAGFCER